MCEKITDLVGQMTEQDETDKNTWDKVDDFKWLKSQQSPNWSILPEESRLFEDIWKSTVPGGPGVSVDDILKKIGLGAR